MGAVLFSIHTRSIKNNSPAIAGNENNPVAKKPEHIWLLCAHRKELEDLDSLLKKFPRLRFFEIGVGMMATAFRFPELLLKMRDEPGAVLLAGSAGSIGDDRRGETALVHLFGMPPLTKEELPEIMESLWSSEPFLDPSDLPGSMKELCTLRVYASFGVSVDSDRYRAGIEGGWENMEAAMVSYLCRENSIPFQALLYCTNRVGPEGRKEWAENYQKGAGVLRQKIEELLSKNRLAL